MFRVYVQMCIKRTLNCLWRMVMKKVQITKIKKKNRSKQTRRHVLFAEEFDKNAKYQLKKLSKAITEYEENAGEAGKLLKRISGNSKILIQPRALAPFAKRITSKLNEYGCNSAYMFTIIIGDLLFGIDDLERKSKEIANFRRQVQEWLEGYDYIATVAFDFFNNVKFANSGTCVSPHIHGIFFDEIKKRGKEKISRKIKNDSEENCILRPFEIKEYSRLIDAVHYAFKGPFGGKNYYEIVEGKNGKKVRKRTPLTLKDLITIIQNFKDTPIDAYCFAGGRGISLLQEIRKEMKNA